MGVGVEVFLVMLMIVVIVVMAMIVVVHPSVAVGYVTDEVTELALAHLKLDGGVVYLEAGHQLAVYIVYHLFALLVQVGVNHDMRGECRDVGAYAPDVHPVYVHHVLDLQYLCHDGVDVHALRHPFKQYVRGLIQYLCRAAQYHHREDYA